jgi:NADH-quinone oxidoreductase subunit N
MAVFGVMAYVAGPDDSGEELDHYDRLAKERPFLGAVLAIGVGSLAGIPPLAGFMGKLLLFMAAFQAHLYGLLAVAIVGVVISIFYYFGWIRSAWFETWTPPAAGAAPVRPMPAGPNWAGVATLAVLVFATLLLGIFQAPLTSWLLP